jgi:hypothetical protein
VFNFHELVFIFNKMMLIHKYSHNLFVIYCKHARCLKNVFKLEIYVMFSIHVFCYLCYSSPVFIDVGYFITSKVGTVVDGCIFVHFVFLDQNVNSRS